MSNIGKPAELDEQAQAVPLRWALLLPLLALIGGAALMSWQGISILLAIAMPPKPPVIASAQEMSHTSPVFGEDTWLYAVASAPCAVAAYYKAEGARCVYTVACDTNSIYTPRTPIAICTAERTFSIFALRWRATIVQGDEAGVAALRLERELFWGGQVPPDAAEVFAAD